MTIMGTLKRLLICLLCLALCLGLSAAVLAADNTGSDIRLLKVEGTVTVCSSSGKTYSTREDMRLYNGYVVATSAASYAWITLDGTKVAKLDANSSLELRRSGKELELLLRSGKVYFNVSEPLKEEEKLNIRTSTMVTGVRGTIGFVECIKVANAREAITAVTILEGSVMCAFTDANGGNRHLIISAGKTAAIPAAFQQEDLPEPVVQPLSPEAIPAFVQVEVADDQALQQRILMSGGPDLSVLDPGAARQQLAQDEQEQLNELEQRKAAQDAQDQQVDLVWTNGKQTVEYTVTWVIGEEEEKTTWAKDSMPEHAKPVLEGFTFLYWEPEIAKVTEDATYTAMFQKDPITVTEPGPEPVTQTYIVTFYDENRTTVLWRTTVAYGDMPSYPGATPTKAADAQYTYTFDGWSPAITAVTGDATYTATFGEASAEYTVIFKNEDGTELQSGSVAYGETPVYSGATPTKGATAQYTYTFAGWTPVIEAVTGDATYTATYTETLRSYTVIFQNEDGTELQSGSVAYGETPAYTGATPTKEGTEQVSYTFDGWSPAITAVEGEATYTATYTETPKYSVTWVDGNGDTLKTEQVAYGATPAYTGATPTKTATAQYTYTFNETWSPAITPVEDAVTYTAQFDSTVNEYTVTWVDGNGDTLKTEQVAYGATPAYTGETPTKDADAQYTYTFNDSWSPVITPVEADVTYTAQFDGTVNEYTVTWVDGNGDTLDTEQVAYGETPAYGGTTPTKDADAQYTYTFNDSWSPAITPVEDAVTYTAQFDSTVNEYTVVFQNEDGTELQSTSVAYGDIPVYTEATPTKTADAQYSYTFTGWDQELAAVKADAIYTAQFDRLCIVNVVVPEGVSSITVGGETVTATDTVTVPENSNPAISYEVNDPGYMQGPDTRLTVNGTELAGTSYNIQGGETVTVAGMYKYVTDLVDLNMNGILDSALNLDTDYELQHSLYITDRGSLTTSGHITLTIDEGCLVTNYGTITIGPDDTVDNYGTIENHGVLDNRGTLNNYSGNTINNHQTLFNMGTLNNGLSGTYTGVLNNIDGAVLLNPEGGLINIGVGSSLTNNGLIYRGAFEDENNGSGYVNNGTQAANSGECGSGTLVWWYTTNASGGGYDLTVGGKGAMADYENNGGNITSPWANNLDALSSVTVEDGVTKIGSYAFMGGAFTTMQLTDDVTQIGDCAFQDCTGLTELDLPEGLEEIGGYAFSGCTGLTSLSLPDNLVTLGSNSFNGCTGLESVSVPGDITELGHHAFADCNGLTDVNLGAGLTAIGEYMFYQCPFLISISIPDSVEAIGNSAFSYSGLTEVDIPGSVKIIEAFAFNTCTALETLTISSGVEEIADFAFSGCEGLTKVTIPDSVTRIGAQAFYSLNLTEVTVGSRVEDWGDEVFANNDQLTTLTLTDGLTVIGPYAFDDCGALSTLTIPGTVTSVGYMAFHNCISLSALAIPDSVTDIGGYAFADCTSLAELSLGTGLKTIGASAFAGCSAITTPTTGNGLIFSSELESVGIEAFSGCEGLTELVFVKPVVTIERAAFSGCTGLTHVEFDGKVDTFGDEAFAGCTSLTQVVFEGDPTPDGDFGTGVFEGAPGGFTIRYDSTNTNWTTAVGGTGSWNGYPAEPIL